METNKELERRRDLAAKVGCIVREDLCALAGITEGTEEAWRKRGKAPPHIVLGRSILYPTQGLAEFLDGLRRVRVPHAVRETL